ncbi:MAG TPA: hypothetical protein VMS17_22930 [Gemmataceae bacterium]|nr:hypothetical protein [Gemmataceae bacterium]
MNASLRALLSHVIDYAGLFPPAKLPLDQAIRNYARDRQEADAWMLGRFVIATADLGQLAPYRGGLAAGLVPVGLAAVGRGGDGMRSVQFGVADDMKAAAPFGPAAGGLSVEVLECRGPLDPETATAAVALSPPLTLYYEIVFSGDWRPALGATAAALADRNARRPSWRPGRAGLKLRTGGLDASAFPTIEEVATVIAACRDAGVPLKFTAGMHHPIRRFDAGLNTQMHGFINVFVAGVLAHARRLDEEALRAVLADEDPDHFAFTDAGLSWQDHHASIVEIADARRDFVTSFGSCSFDEPRDDLRALGWL